MKYKFVLLMILLTAISALAQAPRFKIGDHIEFSENSACLGEKFAVQSVGTILEVNPGLGGNYKIQRDIKKGGYRTSPISIPIYYQDCGMRLAAKNEENQENGNAGGNGENNGAPAPNNNAANEDGAKYKEGDRVEFSENGACLGEQFAIPSKGTIIKVDTTYKAYVVQVDPVPGRTPRIVSRPIYTQECGFRPLAGAAPKILTEKLRVDENDTVLADRELLDCDNLKHTGRNGAPPPGDLAQKLIRCLYEKPSPIGQDGAVTMDITEFTLGAPHRWNRNEDLGQGNAATLVYPVHVKWNQKTFYRERNIQVTGNEMMFTCFADTTNLWQCGGAAGPHKDGKKQEILVKKQ